MQSHGSLVGAWAWAPGILLDSAAPPVHDVFLPAVPARESLASTQSPSVYQGSIPLACLGRVARSLPLWLHPFPSLGHGYGSRVGGRDSEEHNDEVFVCWLGAPEPALPGVPPEQRSSRRGGPGDLLSR